MYLVMLGSMIALAVYILIGSVLGLIDINPLSIVFSILTLVLTSLGVNALLGYIFRVHPHQESAVITAYILFFIFTPASTASGYVLLALIAALAMASKYLLVWRGRHIFNPAAIAAVIAGAVGLGYASWWIATPAALIPTLLLGAMVLRKTRRIGMAATYVGVGIVTILLVTALKSGDVLTVASSVLTSWPLLFFAAFMLSEPLTQPPRRWQRYALAVGVAIVAHSQLSIAGIYASPEIALIAGNIFGFLMGQRRAIRLEYIARKQLGNDQVEYQFKPQAPLHFAAGQYIELQLAHKKVDVRGIRRMFTISSSPGEEILRVTVRHYQPSSSFKKALQNLRPGHVLKATGIYGDFILPHDASEKLLLIAGGIGVTPFRSQLYQLAETNDRRDGHLFYSVRNQSDAVYESILSDPRHGIGLTVTDRVDKAVLEKRVSDISERTVYISGPPAMVDSVTRVVRALGARRVITDHFSGY
jgi:glycine betaine catabolism B